MTNDEARKALTTAAARINEASLAQRDAVSILERVRAGLVDPEPDEDEDKYPRADVPAICEWKRPPGWKYQPGDMIALDCCSADADDRTGIRGVMISYTDGFRIAEQNETYAYRYGIQIPANQPAGVCHVTAMVEDVDGLWTQVERDVHVGQWGPGVTPIVGKRFDAASPPPDPVNGMIYVNCAFHGVTPANQTALAYCVNCTFNDIINTPFAIGGRWCGGAYNCRFYRCSADAMQGVCVAIDCYAGLLDPDFDNRQNHTDMLQIIGAPLRIFWSKCDCTNNRCQAFWVRTGGGRIAELAIIGCNFDGGTINRRANGRFAAGLYGSIGHGVIDITMSGPNPVFVLGDDGGVPANMVNTVIRCTGAQVNALAVTGTLPTFVGVENLLVPK